jgi:hypothetical protein
MFLKQHNTQYIKTQTNLTGLVVKLSFSASPNPEDSASF